ncbi:hypothetical protein SAY87_009833 [Trapa incisa]|uniref:DUF4378 domain-containing protein n=1 Tax=Trapa incisa TaxID=236973 RepID=A0AAN7PYB5_9MYRT|nr:hypothetical protein SAY87_009833 [Trapa incisa]
MGSWDSSTSVIAKLMGLDDLPNQHPPIQKRGRVLSEKYFQRVASIGVRERNPSSSSDSSSFGMSLERSEDLSSFIRVVMEGEDKNLHHAKSRCPEEAFCVLRGMSEISCIPQGIDLLRRDSSGDFSRARSCQISNDGYMKSRDFLGHSRYRRDSSNEPKLLGQRPRVTSEEVEEISKQLKHITMRSESLSSSNRKKSRNCQSSVASFVSSFIAEETRKEMSERFMMMEFQEHGSGSRGKTLGEMLSIQSQEMGPENFNYRSLGCRKGIKNGGHITTHSKRSEFSGQPFVYNSREKDFAWMDELLPGKAAPFYSKSQSSCSPNSEFSSSISGADEAGDLSEEKDLNTSAVKEPKTAGRSSRVDTSPCDESSWNSQMKEPVSSSANSSENLLEEELTEFVEEDSASSHSSMGRESFKSFEEVYQQSPDSVLQVVEDETMSDLGIDITGLQILPSDKFDSSEQCVEENRMDLSSEEEKNDGLSFVNFEDTEDSTRFLRAEDSRDFSYLVDVLSEAGLHGGSLIESLIKWQAAECPVDSIIFEVLEKKHGEEKSWSRSERRLFFDRINLVLIEALCQTIFMPLWAKSIAAHMSFKWGAEITKEALWDLLGRQEKEAKKESENVLEDGIGLLDLGECVDIVCREVEKLLVEELEEEFFI